VQNDGQSIEDQLSPMVGGNWASMVNTPLVPMFGAETHSGNQSGNNLEATALKLANWNLSNNTNGRVVLDDARKFRRASSTAKSESGDNNSAAVYGDDGEPLAANNLTPPRNTGNAAPFTGTFKAGSGNSTANGFLGNQSWSRTGQRSPVLSNVSPSRFGSNDSDPMANPGINFGMSPGGPLSANAMAAMGMNGMNMPPFNMFNGMNGLPNMSPINGLVGGMEGLALNPLQQAQIFAAQLAASGYNPAAFGVGGLQQQGGRGGRSGGRSPGKGSSSLNGRGDGSGGKDKEEDVDPAVLNDVPSWLRSLRLHKYTPNFEGMTWKDMVVMDEAALEAKGVAALGARRKLLKTFEVVRTKMGVEIPTNSS
jgi:RNA-binding protein VTS1